MKSIMFLCLVILFSTQVVAEEGKVAANEKKMI